MMPAPTSASSWAFGVHASLDEAAASTGQRLCLWVLSILQRSPRLPTGSPDTSRRREGGREGDRGAGSQICPLLLLSDQIAAN